MVNKKYLARKLSKRTILSQKESTDVVDELFKIILEEVKKGKDVSIKGFGKFYLYEHTPRPVRNPKTNEEMILEKFNSLKFKASGLLKKKIKNTS